MEPLPKKNIPEIPEEDFTNIFGKLLFDIVHGVRGKKIYDLN